MFWSFGVLVFGFLVFGVLVFGVLAFRCFDLYSVAQDFSHYSSVQSYLNDLKWAPLKDRRRDIRTTYLFKIVTGRVAEQAEGTLLPADSRTRHKHKHKYLDTYQQPVTSAWTLPLSKLSPFGTPYQRRASQRMLLPHSSHACTAPHSAALR